MNLRELVIEKQIDVSKLDVLTQKMFEEISKKNEDWRKDVKYLETIIFQNQVLLLNIEELKHEFKEKTKELKLQNEELLSMNHFLVERAQEVEEKEKSFLARQAKRKSAQKQQRRDYINSTEFFEILYKIVYKSEDSRYIVARTRIVFV